MLRGSVCHAGHIYCTQITAKLAHNRLKVSNPGCLPCACMLAVSLVHPYPMMQIQAEMQSGGLESWSFGCHD